MSHETEVFRSCEYWRPISYCPVRLSSFSMSPIYTEQGDSSGRLTGPGLRSANTIFKGMASGESTQLLFNSHLSFHSLPC